MPKRRPPDLRIDATPEELARAITRGEAEPRPETKPQPAPSTRDS